MNLANILTVENLRNTYGLNGVQVPELPQDSVAEKLGDGVYHQDGKVFITTNDATYWPVARLQTDELRGTSVIVEYNGPVAPHERKGGQIVLQDGALSIEKLLDTYKLQPSDDVDENIVALPSGSLIQDMGNGLYLRQDIVYYSRDNKNFWPVAEVGVQSGDNGPFTIVPITQDLGGPFIYHKGTFLPMHDAR